MHHLIQHRHSLFMIAALLMAGGLVALAQAQPPATQTPPAHKGAPEAPAPQPPATQAPAAQAPAAQPPANPEQGEHGPSPPNFPYLARKLGAPAVIAPSQGLYE